LGTIKAKHKPRIVLTSNRTRDLGDALRRRCLYYWIDYPSVKKEKEIIKKHLPDIEDRLVNSIVAMVNHLRSLKLNKSPGIAETIEWAQAIVALGDGKLDKEVLRLSLSAVLKSSQDKLRLEKEAELKALSAYA